MNPYPLLEPLVGSGAIVLASRVLTDLASAIADDCSSAKDCSGYGQGLIHEVKVESVVLEMARSCDRNSDRHFACRVNALERVVTSG